MKKTILAVTVLALTAAMTPRAAAGDREWATAGKILTGVVAGSILSQALAPPTATVTYVTPAPVMVTPQPVVVQQVRVVQPAPIVVQQVPVVVQPAPVVVQPVCAPPPVVVYAPPVRVVPPPVVGFHFGYHHGGYPPGPYRHCRW